MIENSVYSFLFSFVLTICLMPPFIRYMRYLQKQGQPIRETGPQTHFAKQGTPTMGGVLILSVILVSSLIFAPVFNPSVALSLLVMICFGLVGFEDDFCKLKRHSANSGITGKRRLFAEFLIGSVAVLWALSFLPAAFSTKIYFPLVHYWLPVSVFYVAFGAFLLAGTANSVNLTDGLDGLVSLPLIFVFTFLCGGAWIVSDSVLALRFSLRYIPYVADLCPVCCAAIGALCGFLIFNHKPAKIFMGDVGALGLGGMIAIMSILIKCEVLFGIVCLLFVIEALSDIIQVAVYKRTQKRVFLMAPIHHHFEKKGWSEVKVVRVFWLFSFTMLLLGCIIGVL